MSSQETKDALKEALKEWLDEKYATFGKWALWSIFASGLAAVLYFIIQMNGFRHI